MKGRQQQKTMNPEVFIKADEMTRLIQALRRFAQIADTGSYRRSTLTVAGIHNDMIGEVTMNASANAFAVQMATQFEIYQVSHTNPNYHPSIQLLTYLQTSSLSYHFTDQERDLFQIMLKRGQTNFKALAARRSVGRIESPLGQAIGTGVLVDQNVLLTCFHVIEEHTEQELWVRFGYTQENMPDSFYRLESDPVSANLLPPEYALLRIKGNPELLPLVPKKKALDSRQTIYLIHHPQGRPLEVSEAGKIVEVSKEFIDHSIPAEEGSSGGAILDKDWQFVAMHRGKSSMGRSAPTGTTEGIRLSALWDILAKYIST